MPAAKTASKPTYAARQALTARDALVPWMAPELTGINRLPGRATLLPYADAKAALAGKDARQISLDGTWKFKLMSRVEDTPADFPASDLDTRRWDDIQVPGNWQMQGHGRPHYTNVRMPFAPTVPPVVPEANPTGLYRTTFSVPKSWAGQRIILQFGGVETCYSVWLNGEPIGLGKGSRMVSEYDITAWAKSGANQLAVQVLQWADSSYIEDQDHWRMAGIQRSVQVYATAPAYIQDLFARAGFDHASGLGSLRVEFQGGAIPAKGWKARVQVFDAKGKPCLKKALEHELPFDTFASSERDGYAVLMADLPKVSPWSAEHPTLYTVVASLINAAGREVEATRTRIGFKSVVIANRELRINGRMVYIRGVNRHEHHDRTGKAVDRATMLLDVKTIKAFNFNAVRTSHYPPDPYFLDLCDEHGIYVLDEADIESHHHYNTLTNDPRYALAFLDRGMRMVLRDRNHAAIIGWSLGNESGHGPNHDAMAGWIRHVDPSRYVHYEGAISRPNSTWENSRLSTDVICPMYAPISELVRWATTPSPDPRPFILCEYVHAMGNSCGSISDYWAAIEQHHGLQGGFIWELLDHGIVKRDADGREYWAYGGDFGETPHDTNFCCDGLVWPDRAPHPAMQECKFLFRPIRVTANSPAHGEVKITNHYDFTSTAHLAGTWQVLVDGVAVAHGAVPKLDLAPGASQVVNLGYRLPALHVGQEAHLLLRFCDTRVSALLGKDHEVAWDELVLPANTAVAAVPVHVRVAPASAWQISETRQAWTVANERVELTVAKDTGRIANWRVDGTQQLLAGPQLTVWRAPTDNDGIRAWDMKKGEPAQFWYSKKPLTRWIEAGLDQVRRRCEGVTVRRADDGTVRITAKHRVWGENAKLPVIEAMTAVLASDGSLAFDHAFTVTKGLPDLPRLGVELLVPRGHEALEWFGRGPHESYADRKSSAWVARFRSTVTAQYVPYIMPQEHGNLTDLRWLSLRDQSGAGLLMSANGTIEGKATHLSDEEQTRARHTVELKPSEQVHLYLDVRQRGLGTGSCGPQTLAQYEIPAGGYRLAYRLLALAATDDAGQRHRR